MQVPLWAPFVSQLSLIVVKNAIIDIESKEWKILVFICTCDRFTHSEILFATQTLYLADLLVER